MKCLDKRMPYGIYFDVNFLTNSTKQQTQKKRKSMCVKLHRYNTSSFILHASDIVYMQYRYRNINKKLSYRSVTAPCAMSVNSCYVSRASKVSNSKSDLPGYSRALTMMPFDRPHTILAFIAIMSLSCMVSR